MYVSKSSDEPAPKQHAKQKLPEDLIFLIGLWTLIPCLVLFFIWFGLSFFRVSLLIQVMVVVAGIVVISVRTIRLYRGVRERMLAKAKAGPEAIIGSLGIATTDLRTKGEVRVNGEFWQAMAEEGWIEKDREVEVVSLEGLTLTVRRVKEKAEASSG